jgi:hypothetical protein
MSIKSGYVSWIVAISAVLLAIGSLAAGQSAKSKSESARARPAESSKASTAPEWIKVGTSGKTLVVFCGSVIKGVGSAPTLSIDGGTAVTLADPWTDPKRPYVIWPLAKPIDKGDKVTLSAPAGWITTATGALAAAKNVSVVNGVGVEFYPPFEPKPRTMLLGNNLTPAYYGQPIRVFANAVKESGGWSGDANVRFSVDANGDLESLANWQVTSVITKSEGYDSVPTGKYTVMWEGGGEVVLASMDGTGRVTPGTSRLGGKRSRDSVRVYNVAKAGSKLLNGIWVIAKGAPVRNLRVYGPDVATDGSQRFRPEFLRMLAGSRSIRAMEMLRTNQSNLVHFSEWTPRSLRSYVGSRHTVGPVSIASVKAYDNASHCFYDNDRFYAVITTTEPHKFVTGYKIKYTGISKIRLTDGTQSALSTGPILVLSPTSFAVDAIIGKRAAKVDGVQRPGGTVSATVSSGTISLEELCELANLLPGCDLWFTFPELGTDECATKTFALLARKLAPGHKLRVEYSNEVWNFGFSARYYARMRGALDKIGDFQWYAKRSHEIHEIAAAAFAAAGRPNDVVRVFGSQAGWVGGGGPTDQVAAYCQKQGYPIDELAVAPYFNSQAPKTWDVDQCLDAASVALELDPIYGVTLESAMAGHQRSLTDRGHTRASVVAYEGSFEHLSRDDTVSLYAGRHPRIRGHYLRYLEIMEKSGMTRFDHFDVGQNIIHGQNWPMYYGWAMRAGMGDGSDGLWDNRLTMKYDNGVAKEDPSDRARIVSPVGQAWREWAALTPAPPTVKAESSTRTAAPARRSR